MHLVGTAYLLADTSTHRVDQPPASDKRERGSRNLMARRAGIYRMMKGECSSPVSQMSGGGSKTISDNASCRRFHAALAAFLLPKASQKSRSALASGSKLAVAAAARARLRGKSIGFRYFDSNL